MKDRRGKARRAAALGKIFPVALGMALACQAAVPAAARDAVSGNEALDVGNRESTGDREDGSGNVAGLGSGQENVGEAALGEEGDAVSGNKKAEDPAAGRDGAAGEIDVPIYSYDVTDVVAPARYAVAMNPLGLEIGMGDGTLCTDQVVSRCYGILNKSSTNQVVDITLTVEDLNGGQLTFVDSEEAAKGADADTYAVYLAAIPAASGSIKCGGEAVSRETTAEDLSDVTMKRDGGRAVVLHEGENQISFRLSAAEYEWKDGGGIPLDAEADSQVGAGGLELTGLAPDGAGVAAFTFGGAMNPKAQWGKLTEGVRISVSYSYQAAQGDE